jgi:hypothetical protein
MVSKDKEFEYVTSQIIRHVERSVDAFKMFAQLISAIVGGSIWLSTQSNVHSESIKTYGTLSNILVTLVTVIASVMIFEDYRAWWGFRSAQSKLAPHVPRPRWRAVATGGVMILCMVVGCVLFWCFNPFVLAEK